MVIIMEALAIKDFHNNRPKFKGVGVYISDPDNRWKYRDYVELYRKSW